MNIITNNIDRGEFKIRVHEGIIFGKENLKKHEELKRNYATKKGIIPFFYVTKDGRRLQSNECLKGSFRLGDHLVNPGTGTWCATKLDGEGNMIEWGYCINMDARINTLQEGLSIVQQLLEREKSPSYIIGYLKTFILDIDLRGAITKDPAFLELLRDKDVFPDPSTYQVGDTIEVKEKTYVIEDSLELGKRWKSVEPIVKKLIRKPVSQSEKEKEPVVKKQQYASNRDQKDFIVRTYQGIIDETLYRHKRGDNRKETIKPCISEFDYINAQKKRVSAKKTCVDNDLQIGPELSREWCATEVDESGLMKEWGFCVKGEVDPKLISSTEKTIWDRLCQAIQYENWTNVTIFSKELLSQGNNQQSIYNQLVQYCNRAKIAPYFEKLMKIINTEFVKLYPWNMVESVEPHVNYLQLKSSLEEIVLQKLAFLEKGTHLDFHTGIVGKSELWYLSYYFIIERLLAYSILSESQEFKMDILQHAKKSNDFDEMDRILQYLEGEVKQQLPPYILNGDRFISSVSGAVVDYSSLLNTITPENRILHYTRIDQSSPLTPQLAFFNKAFVEPKGSTDEKVDELPSPLVKSKSSSSEWNDSQKEFYSHYPEMTDPQFYTRLHRKKEFQTNKMTNWKEKKIEDLCRQDVFDLSPQQQWVSNFFNIETPYKGLLLYWGTGVGKTCASISIAQKHLEYYKKYNRKILVILGTSTMQNYIKELYNFNKEKLEMKNRLIPGSLQCTGDRYYQPILSTDPESMKKRESRILKKIEQDYEFITYGSLKGIIKKLLSRRGLPLELEEQRKSVPVKIPQVEGEEIKSGTVVYIATRTFKGLIWKPVIVKDPQREERIRVALSEYFSNRLIIIDEIQNIRTASDGGDQIAPKMLEMIIHYSSDLKLVMMSATPMFNSATEIVYILNLLLENDRREKIKVNDLFDGKDNLINEQLLLDLSKGYISYVRGANPVSFPKKLLPTGSAIPAIVQNNPLYLPAPVHKMNGQPLEEMDRVRYNALVPCVMSEYQEQIFKKAVLGMADENSEGLEDTTNETFDINGKMISNFVYPLPPKLSFDKTDVTLLYGEKGFDRCFTERKHNQYEYNTEQVSVPILDSKELAEFSPKMDKILTNIMNTEKGIIFVYCEYKKGGSLPFALMLEQNGFEQQVVEGKIGELMVKPKLISRWKKPTLPQKWKYVLLDGDMDPKKRAQIIQRCNSEQNKEGNIIKVIVGTRVASEGVDFSRIRQIHIFNPWDNFSRIDQTIGRGIRNCSHKDLPAEDRNVTVFLYSSHIGDNSIETTDEKIHRRAERKDIQMKHVEFILRNGAVDCLSNFVANQYRIEDFGEEVGDKNGSRECGYGDCTKIYQCIDYDKMPQNMNNSEMDRDTYDIPSHAKRELDSYKAVIKLMFTKAVLFQLDHVRMVCQMKIKSFDESVFLIAMDQMIHKKEKLYDKYHRLGRMVFRDGYYMFQPYDLDQSPELPEYNRETPLSIKPPRAEISVKQKTISRSNLDQWYAEIIQLIRTTDDTILLAYYLDRVKDIVMKQIILSWFNEYYSPSNSGKSIQAKITTYLENKDIIVFDSDEKPIAIQWTKELSYEYVPEQKILVEHINVERFQKGVINYNFDGYNLKSHVIGRLEEVSNGKEESPYKQMTCKIIDFSFVENKSNIKLDGKACMSYNRIPMNKIMENLGLEINKSGKREDQCKLIELELRKLHTEKELDQVWWIESNRLYRLEKIL